MQNVKDYILEPMQDRMVVNHIFLNTETQGFSERTTLISYIIKYLRVLFAAKFHE